MILACRNIEKGEKVRKQIVADCGNDNVKVLQLDLASLASIRQFAETVLSGKLHKTNNDPTTKNIYDEIKLSENWSYM